MDAAQVRESVRTFIVREIIRDESHKLEDTAPLMDSGIIESLSLVALLGFLQSEFKVRVPDNDIMPRNFKDLNAVTALVMRLPKEQAA